MPVVVPIAAVEQHGRHLPVFTDSMLLGEVVRRAAEPLGDRVIWAPLLWLGNSHHHIDFAGTLSAAPRTYLDLLGDLIDNLVTHGFRRIVLLNGHGGNIVPASQAVFEARQRYRSRDDLLLLSATYWLLGSQPDAGRSVASSRTEMGHACEWETSMILRLAPHLVGDLSAIEPVPHRQRRSSRPRGAGSPRSGAQPGHIGDPRAGHRREGRDPVPHLLRRRRHLPGAGDRLGRPFLGWLTWNERDRSRRTLDRDRRTPLRTWGICGLMLLATMLNYMDRQALAQQATEIRGELKLSNEDYGRLEIGLRPGVRRRRDRHGVRWPTGSARAGSTRRPAGLVGRRVRDRLGHQLLASCSLCRVLLGFFEAGHWPCALAASQRLLSRSNRPLGNSILQSGASLGAIATPIVVLLLSTRRAGELAAAVPRHRCGGASSGSSPGCLAIRPRDLEIAAVRRRRRRARRRRDRACRTTPARSRTRAGSLVRRFLALAVVVIMINFAGSTSGPGCR